jgi:hypothetical protein
LDFIDSVHHVSNLQKNQLQMLERKHQQISHSWMEFMNEMKTMEEIPVYVPSVHHHEEDEDGHLQDNHNHKTSETLQESFQINLPIPTPAAISLIKLPEMMPPVNHNNDNNNNDNFYFGATQGPDSPLLLQMPTLHHQQKKQETNNNNNQTLLPEETVEEVHMEEDEDDHPLERRLSKIDQLEAPFEKEMISNNKDIVMNGNEVDPALLSQESVIRKSLDTTNISRLSDLTNSGQKDPLSPRMTPEAVVPGKNKRNNNSNTGSDSVKPSPQVTPMKQFGRHQTSNPPSQTKLAPQTNKTNDKKKTKKGKEAENDQLIEEGTDEVKEGEEEEPDSQKETPKIGGKPVRVSSLAHALSPMKTGLPSLVSSANKKTTIKNIKRNRMNSDQEEEGEANEDDTERASDIFDMNNDEELVLRTSQSEKRTKNNNANNGNKKQKTNHSNLSTPNKQLKSSAPPSQQKSSSSSSNNKRKRGEEQQQQGFQPSEKIDEYFNEEEEEADHNNKNKEMKSPPPPGTAEKEQEEKNPLKRLSTSNSVFSSSLPLNNAGNDKNTNLGNPLALGMTLDGQEDFEERQRTAYEY